MEWVEEVVREWNKDQEAQADWFVIRHLPLHIALFSSAPAEVVFALLSAFPKATMKKDRYGRCPLHFAAQYQAPVEVVSALLFIYPEAARKKDKFGYLPLHIAARNGKIFNIPRIRVPSIRGFDFSDIAVFSGVVSEDPYSVRELGSNLPLHVGLKNKSSAEVVSALLSIYPEAAEEKNSEGNVPLHVALENQASAEVVSALLCIFPQAAREKIKGDNLPLHVALKNKASAEVVSALLSIYPEAAEEKNVEGNLPLYVAFENQAPAEVLSLTSSPSCCI
jgi:ankyrin repeat protein